MPSNIWGDQIHSVCEMYTEGKWPLQDAPFTGEPLTFADFNVTSEDFDFETYGQRVIEKNIVTCAFLSVSFFMFLLFLLWRLLRACCVVCCCADICDERRKKNSDVLWTKRSALLKILIVLAGLTAIALASYSSSNLKITLSEDAWKTIHAVKGKIEEVLDTGDLVIHELEQTIGSLQNVSSIFATDINVTYMETNIECIHTFLEDMPDPGTLKTSISALNTLLTLTIYDELDQFSTSLTTLETDALDAIREPVNTLKASESWFADFKAELTDLDAAIDALETTYDDPVAAETSASNLQTSKQAVRDIVMFVNELEDLKDALNTIAASDANTQMTSVESGITMITLSISTAKSDLHSVETNLNSFQTDYETASPCLTGISTKLETIGQDVIELPTEVSDNRDLLLSVTTPLDDFFAADASTGALMESLSDIGDQIELPDTLNLENQLESAKSDVNLIASEASTFVTDIDGFIIALQAFLVLLDTLQTKLDTYLITSTIEANYLDMRSYATVTILPATSGLVTHVNDITADFADVFDGANNIQSIDASLLVNLDSQRTDVGETMLLIGEIPDLSEMTVTLNEASAAYGALGPTPQTTLADAEIMLDDIQSLVSETLGDVITAVQSTTTDANDALQEAREDSVDEIDTFEKEKRNLTIGHFFDVPEDIGFALLAEDVNNKLYLVTLCFYCMTLVLCIGLVMFVIVNCQFGIGMTLFLFLFLMVFYFFIALISSTILIVENDFCANLEEIVLTENSDMDLDRLLRYYFTNDGALRSVLLEAFELDFRDMEEEAVDASQEAENIIDDWGAKGELLEALNAIVQSVNGLLDLLSTLERSFEFREMHPLYQTIKSFFCCDISSFLFTIWKDLTTTGAISLFVIFLGFFALHKMDKMPRVDCCGCTRRRRYLDGILAESEDTKLIPKSKRTLSDHASRKGTQIGTDVA